MSLAEQVLSLGFTVKSRENIQSKPAHCRPHHFLDRLFSFYCLSDCCLLLMKVVDVDGVVVVVGPVVLYSSLCKSLVVVSAACQYKYSSDGWAPHSPTTFRRHHASSSPGKSQHSVTTTSDPPLHRVHLSSLSPLLRLTLSSSSMELCPTLPQCSLLLELWLMLP